MPSDLRYSLINTFTAIDQFRQSILFNLQGAAQPGFNKKVARLNVQSSLVTIRQSEAAGPGTGVRPQITAGPSELRIGQSSFAFQQGTIGQRVGQTTSLAIDKTDGFFAVAESLNAGARVFLTRDGSFVWKDTTPPEKKEQKYKQFHLTSQNGLFVLRAQDIDLDPASPNFMRLKALPNDSPPGMLINTDTDRNASYAIASDSSVRDGDWIPDRIKGIAGFVGGDPFKLDEKGKRSQENTSSHIAIVKVPLKEFLQESSFGGTIYETNVTSRAGIVGKSYKEWVKLNDPMLVQSESSEQPDFTSIQTEANIQSEVANFVFKNLRDMLDNYNRSIDDLLGLIR